VDGQRLEWSEKDVFAVPGWALYEHLNPGRQDAILFSYTDAPVMTALGLYREEIGHRQA
jgi:gentisate 1,2-dioxygenase